MNKLKLLRLARELQNKAKQIENEILSEDEIPLLEPDKDGYLIEVKDEDNGTSKK